MALGIWLNGETQHQHSNFVISTLLEIMSQKWRGDIDHVIKDVGRMLELDELSDNGKISLST